jgi:DNA-binding transcriptional ArsR family regulator
MCKHMKVNKRKEQREQQREKAQAEIGLFLKDGNSHQYSEMIEKLKGKLSRATISKHLKIMEKNKQVYREVDIKSGKYPAPVYYKISQGYQKALENRYSEFETTLLPELENVLLENKNLDSFARLVGIFYEMEFLELFRAIQERKKTVTKKDNLLLAEYMIKAVEQTTKKAMLSFIENSLLPNYEGCQSVYLELRKKGVPPEVAIADPSRLCGRTEGCAVKGGV